MAETLISPQYLYEHPERFGGILAIAKKSRQLDYPVVLFEFMKKIFPDFPEKLAASMEEYIIKTKDGKAYILIGKDVVDLYEIPDKVYEEIKRFVSL